MTVYSTFLSDPMRENNYPCILYPAVREVQGDGTPWDTTTLRFASRKFDTGPYDTPANTRFWSRLVGVPYFYRASRAPVGTTSFLDVERGGQIVLGQRFGDLDSGDAYLLSILGIDTIRDLYFGGRNAAIYHGGFSDLTDEMLFSDYQRVFNGKMEEKQVTRDAVTIPLRSDLSQFDTPLQSRVFSGSGFSIYSDGSAAYVSLGHNTDGPSGHDIYDASIVSFGPGNSGFAIGFRFWIESLPGAAVPIICRGAQNVDGMRILLNSSGTISFETNQSGAHQTVTTDTTFVTGRMYHLILAYNGDTDARFYVDGVKDGDTKTGLILPTSNATRDLFFFRDNASGATNPNIYCNDITWFNEDIATTSTEDLLTIPLRPLTATEASAANVIGCWNCNEGTGGTTVTDISAYTNHGTVTGCQFYPSLTGSVDNAQGQPLPDCFGFVEGFDAILIDEARQIYQAHSSKIEAFVDVDNTTSAVQEGGNKYTLNAAYTSKATWDAAWTATSPPPGKFDSLITNGGAWFRCGSKPNKPITVSLKGDKSDGTYRYKCADIVSYLIQTRGQNLATSGEINSSSFTTLNTANSAVMGFATKQATTVLAVVNFFINSVGAQMWRSRADGKFKVERFAGTSGKTAVLTITEKDVSTDSEDLTFASDPPTWQWLFHYRRCYLKHSQTDLVSGVSTTAVGRFLTKEWRTAPTSRGDVKANYLDAQTVIVDTAFTTAADAYAESNRRSFLYDDQARCFKVKCRDRMRQLDLFDAVYFHYQDYAEDGSAQSRLGTSATDKFVILSIEEQEDNEVELIIWQEGS